MESSIFISGISKEGIWFSYVWVSYVLGEVPCLRKPCYTVPVNGTLLEMGSSTEFPFLQPRAECLVMDQLSKKPE